MEEIINRLRKSKRKVKKVFNMLRNEIDLKDDLIDSRILELATLAKIDEELTEIIYLILDSKNS